MTKITFDKQREVFNTLGSKQFDSSEPFKAEFLNGGEPIDLSQYNIRFECKKPDGNIVIDDENITIKNICEIEMYLNEQVTVVNGKVDCQFVLVNKMNEKQTSTFTFYMDIQQSVLGINGYSRSLITIAEKLAKDVIEARKLHNDLTSDIATGNKVKDDLVSKTNTANTTINTLTQKTNIGNETVNQLIYKTAIASQEKINLESTITDAIEKDGILTMTTVLADTTNTILQQSVDQAQDNINTINATANNSKIILPEHWIGVEPNLTYTWNHRLNTKNISVDIFDEITNETLFWSVGRPDENNMVIRSKTRRHLRIVLGAKYYSGGDLNSNEEIIEARKGEGNLRNKIDKIDSILTKNANDIILANASLEQIDQQKASKNETRENTITRPINVSEMDTETKKLFTGGAVPVVEKGAILTENIVSKQITPNTTSFFDIVNFMDISSIKFVNNYVTNGGSITSGTLTKSIIFKVEPNTKYKLKADGVVMDRGNVVGAVDNDFSVGSTKEVLVIGGLLNNIMTFTTGANTNWVFIYFASSGNVLSYYESVKSKFMLFKNNIPNEYFDTMNKSYLPKDIIYKGDVEPQDTNFFKIYNLLSIFKYEIVNGNCNVDGKTYIPTNSKSIIIDVKPSTQYTIKLPLNTDRSFILSTNDIFVDLMTYEILQTTSLGNRKFKFTTSGNTKKIFVYYNSTITEYDISEFELVYNDYDLGKEPTLKEEFIPPINESYIGKKVLTIGDSITAINESEISSWERSWRKYFKEIFKPIKLSNTAVPGATWRDKNGSIYDGNPVINGVDNNINNVIGNQIEKLLRARDINHPNYSQNLEYDDEFDVIIIACGTNDLNNAIPTREDIETQFHNGVSPISNLALLDRKSWAGAMRYAVDNLRKLYPNAQIFVCTPIQRTGNNYGVILDKNITITNITRRLSINLIDTMVCGVYDMTCPSLGQEGDFNDGLHLSPQGAKKMGYFIANEIKNKLI